MIEVVTINPAKNSTGVPVNQNIEINILADFELDPRNVSFKINDIDIIPNVFSVYQGGVDYDLDITLYTKKRIKYNTGKRYGADDTRYGMTDVFPSILQYGSRYVVEFTAWGTNDLGEEETLTDSFVFTTEEGIFYNTSPVDYFYSDSTQGIANYFPEWSKTRSDKFSNFQQLINPLGEELEKMQDFVVEQGLNNHIQTADLNQLAVLHKVELGKDFEITSNLNEDGSSFYVQPEITAIQDITRYDLFTEQNNNLKDFHYDKLPTRLGVDRLVLESEVIKPLSIAQEIKEEVDLKLEKPGAISIRAIGVNSSIFKDEKDKVLIVKCRLYGESLFGTEQIEDIILYNDRFIYTKKLWSQIDSIQFFNLFGQEVQYELKYFRDAKTVHRDYKQGTTFDDNRENLYWRLESRDNKSILSKEITVGETGADLLRNSGRTIPIQEYQLFDIDNQTTLDLTDLSVDPFTNDVYGIDDEYLYIFDKREPYPIRLKEIPGDNGIADMVIELDSDELGLDDTGQKEIQLKCIHKNFGKTVVRYRLRVSKPDGTEIFVKADGTFTSNPSEASVAVQQDNLFVDEIVHCFSVDQVGDYIFDLEVVYQGGGASRHKQLARVLGMSAKSKYKLERILGEEVPVSLFFDHDQRLKIYTNAGILQELVLHRDGVLIDYDDKILYFSEEYDSVDVE